MGGSMQGHPAPTLPGGWLSMGRKRNSSKGKMSVELVKIFFSTLSGNNGLGPLVVLCALAALILLAYVSTQVYTNSLLAQLTGMEKRRELWQEKVNRLSSLSIGLGSRSRVRSYCRGRLGMVDAEPGDLVFIAVEQKGPRANAVFPPKGHQSASITAGPAAGIVSGERN